MGKNGRGQDELVLEVRDTPCLTTDLFQLRITTETRKKLKEEMDKLLVEINGIKTSGQSLSRIEVIILTATQITLL